MVLTILAAGWLGAFGAQTLLCWRSLRRWQAASSDVEALAGALIRDSSAIVDAVLQIKEDDAQTAFLQGLVNVLPQEKGFVRTERAMSDEVDLLRRKVSRRIHNDLHILVDTKANKLYLKRGLTVLWSADCSVGKGGVLVDKQTGRRWEFVTPLGQFEVQDKYANPLWNKPDWAFVESGEPVPPPEDPRRKVPGELGNYVLNLGDGYLIHGTKTEALLGRSVSHGCVRLGAADLQRLYETVPVGTRVYIY
ncbi:MAG TPA: L,D-transpeptidase [Elusimicrobiota bacterium]|nr:L,D-transpeptidase [Elusimicrobiota bacterium]